MESSRSDGGASLPPRKRLLAGLKQNGWFSDEKNSNPNPNGAQICRSDSDSELGLGFESPKKEALGLGLGFGEWCNSEGGGACHSVVFSKTSESSVHKCLDRKTLLDVCRPAEACCSTAESRTVDAVDGSVGNCSLRKLENLLKTSPLSLEELVVEARADVAKAEEAVSLAKEAVSLAKEAASRKAEEAVRAASAAKEALNVAARAAKEERAIKKHSLKHGAKNSLAKNSLKHEGNKVGEGGVVKEGMGAVSKMSVLDDEELARRLHRAINSSPRISRNTVSLARESDFSRAHPQRGQTRLRGSFEKKQEEKAQNNKSESVNWGKLGHKTDPGSQSACGKFVGSPIDKLLQTLDHSETESSVGLLALNQDPSVHKPIVETEPSNCTMVELSVAEYDEKASDAGRVLKELRVCNYSQGSLKDGNSGSVEPEAGNLEKLAETVAVVIEEENSRYQEDKMDRCIKEETASCSIKCIEHVGTHQNPEPGEATSQKLGGVKRKRPSLDSLKTNECGSRLSKSSRTPVHAGMTYHGNIALDGKCSPVSNDSTMRLHARRSNSRNLERRTKSISGDFPQESQGSARVISSWHQDVLKPSQSFAGNVNLSPHHSAPQMPLQSPAFASGASRKHV